MTNPATVDDLLAAATRCFAASGFAATTLDDIASEAGVSRATAFRRHGGKWAYVEAVMMTESEGLISELDAVLPTIESIDSLIRVLVSTAVRHITTSPVMARAAGPDLEVTLPRFTTESSFNIEYLTVRLSDLLLPLRGTVLPRVEPDIVLLFAEESVRFVLGRVTTPTLDGLSLDPDAAAERAAVILVPAVLALFR